MAIVGKVWRIAPSFNENLIVLRDYFEAILREGSSERERVFALKAGESKRIELSDGIYAIEQSYMSKSHDKAFFESHQTYIDFQLVLDGEEVFCIGEKGDFTLLEMYDSARDLIVYEPKYSKSCSQILLNAEDLAIFLPYDVHAGGLHSQESSKRVVKTVVKVKKELLDLKI